MRGIYEVDGDNLRWAAAEPGMEKRPTTFPAQEGDFKELGFKFKRTK